MTERLPYSGSKTQPNLATHQGIRLIDQIRERLPAIMEGKLLTGGGEK